MGGAGVPVFLYVAPAIVLACSLSWVLIGRRIMSSNDRRYRAYRLGELAQRMGLQIVEGDPALNMVQAHAVHSMRKADMKVGGRLGRALGDRGKETRVLLQGAPYGRPTTFLFHKYTEYADRVVVGIWRTGFACRLALQLPTEVPAFEIVGRASLGDRYLRMKATPEWGLPRQSFGNRELDGKLSLTSADPRLGPYLAPIVGSLVGHRYVHIQGHRDVIQALSSEEAVGYAVLDLERTQDILEHMAAALAGPVHPGSVHTG